MAIISCLLLSVFLSSAMSSANIHSGNLESLIKANTEFAIDLYKQIAARDQTKNIVYSPVSVAAALAMLKLGTVGNSSTEIDTALHLSGIESALVNAAFGELNGILFDKPQDNITLRGANGAFISNKKTVLKSYRNALTVFGAEIKELDFSKSKSSRSAINKWIAEKTNDEIKDMVTEDSMQGVTALLLANALFFTGEWHSGFNPKMTDERAFYVSHYKVIKTPFMFQRGKFKYAYIEPLAMHVVELPYAGKEISMIILLPEDFNVDRVEKNLNHESLKEWTDKLEYETVDLTMPKFKIEDTLDLHSHLQELGITSVFDSSKADLSGISGDKSLFVDNIMHRGILEVTEEGSTAAAATTIRVVARSLQFEAQFLADRPFVWMLQHRQTGQVLFLGRFSQPDGVVQQLGGLVAEEREEARRASRSEMKMVYADHSFIFVIKNTKKNVLYQLGVLKRPAGKEVSHDEL